MNDGRVPRVMAITGSSRGIGRGIAEHFCRAGYRVCGCSRGAAGFSLEGYAHSRVDVGDEAQVRGWIRSIRKEHGRLDVLVCNAGLVRSALLAAVTPADVLEGFLRTHVAGTYYACREASKAMIAGNFGRIITVSSLGVPLHLEGTSAYSASKSAVEEMTRILAKELAPAGITCNVLAPALTETEPVRAMGKEWFDRLLEKQTIKRTVSIDEICNIIEFFASERSGAVTGQVISMGLVA